MKLLRRWGYLVLFICTGIGYLSYTDNWSLYNKFYENVSALVDTVRQEHTGEIKQQEIIPTEGFVWKIDDMADDYPWDDAGETSIRQDDQISQSDQNSDQWNSIPEKNVYMTVEDDYFQDAAFIGDSRTVGMYEYGGLSDISTFYASTGLNIFRVFSSNFIEVPGQKKKINLETAMEGKNFKKVYLMLGINEMGRGTVDSFIAEYQTVIEKLKEMQPESIIYVQAIMKVTEKRSAQGDYITNEGIDERNNRLAELADNVRVFYLDCNSVVCDETGGMIADYTYDGVHLKAQYIKIWKDFLKSHAIDLNKIEQN